MMGRVKAKNQTPVDEEETSGTLNLEKFIQINLERTGMRKTKAHYLSVQAVEGKKVLAE